MRVLGLGAKNEMSLLREHYQLLGEAVEREEDVDTYLSGGEFDVVLVDIDEKNGIIRRLRKKTELPLICLTNRDDTARRAEVLRNGADYCLMRGVSGAELNASMNACVRRRNGQTSQTYTAADLILDPRGRICMVRDERVHLTTRECGILEHLMLHKGEIVRRNSLFLHVYQDYDVEVKIIDVFMCKIRRKIDIFDEAHIETIWSVGFRLLEKPVHISELRKTKHAAKHRYYE